MAGRRSAHLRHVAGGIQNTEAKPQSNVRQYEDRLEAAFHRGVGRPENIVNLSKWLEMGTAAPTFAEAF